MKLKKLISCTLAAAMAVSISIPSLSKTDKSFNSVFAADTFIESSADQMESAYVTWSPISGATEYNVYYKISNGSYTKLDSMLIRQYSGYFRADAVGLKPGSYTMKVVPIFNGKEDDSKAIESSAISVKSYDRSGFSFSSNSPNGGKNIGAYNDDGTLKQDAVVLYLTEDTKNTLAMDVVTNAKGSKTSCTGISAILTAIQKGYETRPIAIRIIGQVTADGVTGSGDSNNLLIKGNSETNKPSNITIEGIGEDAVCYKFGIRCVRSSSIEIRNLAVMLFGDDGIALETANTNIWIHNNDIFYGTAGSDADQAKGDGSMDLKNDSKYITISYNHFWDSGKMSLCGMKSETGENWITYHHNWFDHSDSRHPRIRTMSVHVYNNYYDGNSKYGVGVTMGASAFVEANYFKNCKYPMLSSMQGTDATGEGTFSGENGGMIKAYGNSITGASGIIYQTDNSASFDAYLASSKDEKVPQTYKAVQGGTTYNNFDTNSDIMYNYTPDAAENVPQIVMSQAGRMNGGDFDFEFTSADDTDYSVNKALMAKITGYTSPVIAIGSGFTTGGDIPPVTTETTTSANPIVTTSTSPSVTTSVVTSISIPILTSIIITGDTLFCSPDASDTGSGTLNNPMPVEKAIEKIPAGGQIYLMGGTYKFDSQLTIPNTNSGSQGLYKYLRNYDNQEVIFDFSAESYNSSDTSKNDRGIQLDGSYWNIYGIKVYNAADNGMYVTGNNNKIEMCVFQANRDSGLQISRRSSSLSDIKDWPTNNLILNCTSFDNMDPATGENADGFAAKLTCGTGNIFDGCIAYNNVDDGWDLYAKTETGPIGAVTIKNCISFRNGATADGTFTENSDGNGFKLGGGGVGTPHIVENCIAFENKKHGFTDNNNPTGISLINCTSYSNGMGDSNGSNYQMDRAVDGIYKNLLTYKPSSASEKFVGTISNSIYYNSSKYYMVDKETAIAKDKVGTVSSGVPSEDFASLDTPAMNAPVHTLWRNADGSITTNGFLMLKDSSAFYTMGAKFSYGGNEGPVVKYGDTDCSGIVDIVDVVLLNKYLLNSTAYSLTNQGKLNADCINDGVIAANDSGIIQQYLANLITEDELGK